MGRKDVQVDPRVKTTFGRAMASWPDPRAARRLRDGVSEAFHVDKDKVKCVAAPYRVCPVGAHVDHQGGLVSGFAIDQGVLLAFFPSKEVNLISNNFKGAVWFSLDKIPDARESEEEACWGDYARGAVLSLKKAGYPLNRGITGMIEGQANMQGCGVSSSAALGCALLLAFEEANNLKVSPMQNVKLDCYIENIYLSLKNGIMDPSIVLMAKKGHLVLVDCEKESFELIPRPNSMIPPPFRVLLVFSGISSALTGTDFNNRVEECNQAARKLLEARGGIVPVDARLCALDASIFQLFQCRLSEVEQKRAMHFFTECARVRSAVEHWCIGDWESLGKVMFESCESSIHNYECGIEPLTELISMLKSYESVIGARFSGAGFRGCCVALVGSAYANDVAADVLRRYRERYPEYKDVAFALVAEEADGARVVELCDRYA